MKNRRWFVHYLKKSIGQRRGRTAVAALSVMVATAMVVVALGLSIGIGNKLGEELKAYGANIIAAPKEGMELDEKSGERLLGVEGVEGFSAQLYGRAFLKGKTDVEVMGIEFGKLGNWRVTGSLPSGGEALSGVNLRDALGLKINDRIKLSTDKAKAVFKISGFVERGGAEDNSLMLNLTDAQGLFGLHGRVSSFFIRGKAERIERTVRLLSEVLPVAEVKSLRQVAHAEESFLKKIKLLMILVSLVVVPAACISVSSTMSATILERIKEIGLMKAMGGTKGEIRLFYLVEAGVIGFVGGVTGYITGYIASQAVSMGAFHSYISVPFYAGVISILLGLLIAVSSSAVPLRGALSNKPSVILRGE
jgi:putative ABC transport system permease protein